MYTVVGGVNDVVAIVLFVIYFLSCCFCTSKLNVVIVPCTSFLLLRINNASTAAATDYKQKAEKTQCPANQSKVEETIKKEIMSNQQQQPLTITTVIPS